MQTGVWLTNRTVAPSTWKSLARRPRGHAPRSRTSGAIPLPFQQRRKTSTVPPPPQAEIAAGAPPPGDDAHTATEASSTPPRHRKGPRRRISTLDPTKLTPSDHVDLSGRERVHAMLAAHAYSSARRDCAYLIPTGWPTGPAFKFPPGTRGFLYYRAPWGPALAGEVRFRLARTSDRAGFAAGADLRDPHGAPWSIPLYNIPLTPSHRSLQAQLLRDGLVPQRAFDTVLAARAGLACHASHASTVVAFGQDFRLGFSPWLRGSSLVFVGADSVARYVPRGTMGFGSLGVRQPPFQDSAIVCCFERSRLREHKGKRVVVLRLKRFLDHPPNRDLAGSFLAGEGTTKPREGELLMSLSHGRARVWAVDVDAQTNVRPRFSSLLKVLFENEERYGPYTPQAY